MSSLIGLAVSGDSEDKKAIAVKRLIRDYRRLPAIGLFQFIPVRPSADLFNQGLASLTTSCIYAPTEFTRGQQV